MSVKKGTSYIAGRTQVDATPVSGSNNAVSSGGVYTALQDKAPASLSTSVAALDAALSAKANNNQVVHTTGNESISGTKSFTQLIEVKYPTTNTSAYQAYLRQYHPQIANNYSTIDLNRGMQSLFYANDGTLIGYFTSERVTDGSSRMSMTTRSRSASDASNYNVTLWVGSKNGTTPISYAPRCDNVDCILTNVALNRGQSGYLKLGNHVMIQWGTWYIGSAGTTVTLPTAFADANYIIGASTETYQMGNTACYNKTTTTFQAWTSDDSSFNAAQLNYIAIGRW